MGNIPSATTRGPSIVPTYSWLSPYLADADTTGRVATDGAIFGVLTSQVNDLDYGDGQVRSGLDKESHSVGWTKFDDIQFGDDLTAGKNTPNMYDGTLVCQTRATREADLKFFELYHYVNQLSPADERKRTGTDVPAHEFSVAIVNTGATAGDRHSPIGLVVEEIRTTLDGEDGVIVPVMPEDQTAQASETPEPFPFDDVSYGVGNAFGDLPANGRAQLLDNPLMSASADIKLYTTEVTEFAVSWTATSNVWVTDIMPDIDSPPSRMRESLVDYRDSLCQSSKHFRAADCIELNEVDSSGAVNYKYLPFGEAIFGVSLPNVSIYREYLIEGHIPVDIYFNEETIVNELVVQDENSNRKRSPLNSRGNHLVLDIPYDQEFVTEITIHNRGTSHDMTVKAAEIFNTTASDSEYEVRSGYGFGRSQYGPLGFGGNDNDVGIVPGSPIIRSRGQKPETPFSKVAKRLGEQLKKQKRTRDSAAAFEYEMSVPAAQFPITVPAGGSATLKIAGVGPSSAFLADNYPEYLDPSLASEVGPYGMDEWAIAIEVDACNAHGTTLNDEFFDLKNGDRLGQTGTQLTPFVGWTTDGVRGEGYDGTELNTAFTEFVVNTETSSTAVLNNGLCDAINNPDDFGISNVDEFVSCLYSNMNGVEGLSSGGNGCLEPERRTRTLALDTRSVGLLEHAKRTRTNPTPDIVDFCNYIGTSATYTYSGFNYMNDRYQFASSLGSTIPIFLTRLSLAPVVAPSGESVAVIDSNFGRFVEPNDFTPTNNDGTAKEVPVGETASFSFAVTHNVDVEGEFSVNDIVVGGDLFSLATDVDTSAVISGTDKLPFTIAFAGTTVAGTYRSDIRVVSSGMPAEYVFRVQVVVTEVPIAAVTIAPAAAEVNIASGRPAIITATIANEGAADLEITADDKIVLVGDASFAIWEPPVSSVIAPGDSLSFSVEFKPSTLGVQQAYVDFATNLASETLRVTFTASGVVQPEASILVNNAAAVDGVYDAGVVSFGSSGTYTASIALSNIGGGSLTIESVAASGTGRIVTTGLSGTAVDADSTKAISVSLPLARNAYAETTVTVVTSAGTDEVTIRAFGATAASVSVVSGSETYSAVNPLVIAPAIASQTTSRSTVQLKNSGGTDVVVADLSVASSAAAGLAVSTAAVGQTVAANGGVVDVQVTFSPRVSQDETESMVSVFLEGSQSPITFHVVTSTDVLYWGSEQRVYDVAEGDKVELAVVLPSSTIKDFDLIIVSEDGTTAENDVDFSVDIVRDSNEALATVIISVTDDLDEEPSETIRVQLVTDDSRSELVAITILASDPVTTTSSLDEADDETEITVTATGSRPGQARDDGNDRGTVNVRLNKSDTVRQDGSTGGGSITVTVVNTDDVNETNDLADPDFNDLADETDDGTLFETAGASFVIDLDDGVTINPSTVVDVTVSYECGTTDELVLMLFDTEASPPAWVDSKSKCLPSQPWVAPVVDDSDAANGNCKAAFTICHLTQFVVAKKVVKAADTPSGGVSGAVDETASGADGASDDDEGLGAGYIVIACFAGVAVIAVAFFVLRKNNKDEDKPATAAYYDEESASEFSAAAASSASSVASSSAASSSLASSSASGSDSSSALSSGSDESSS